MYIQLWQAILNFVTEYYRFVSLYVGKYESTLSLFQDFSTRSSCFEYESGEFQRRRHGPFNC